MNEARFDVVVDLGSERIVWRPLHEALEALDEAGFVPHRFHTVPERELARIDGDVGGTFAPRMAGGGGWIIERKIDAPVGLPTVLGCAGYGARTHRSDPDLGLAGPFALDGDLAPFRATLLLGALFSLRERGYRRALIEHVSEGALMRLREIYGSAIIDIAVARALPPARVVVCASGSGSNFQAVVDAVASERLALHLTRLVVNRSNAFALERARAAGIDTRVLIWKRAEEERDAFDARVLAAVAETEPDLVLLLGWMHLLPPAFVARFTHLINVHPAFLPLDPGANTVTMPDGTMQPAFRGAHAVDDALTGGAGWIGASVHQVTDETDRGMILARAPLALVAGESREALDERLHRLEHRVLIDAVASWLEDRARRFAVAPAG